MEGGVAGMPLQDESGALFASYFTQDANTQDFITPRCDRGLDRHARLEHCLM